MSTANQGAVAMQPQGASPAAFTGGDAIISMIERAARDPAVDIDKMERLLAMREREMSRTAKASYASAFADMQNKLPAIPERGKGHGQITYALWEDINDLIKPVLAEFGFGISFRVGRSGDRLSVTAVLSHRDGHSEETMIELPADASGSKNAVQAVGSSTTYGKRYTAAALLNLTSRGEDDDGQAGGVGPAITAAQVGELQELLDSTGAPKADFLKWAKVERLADISAGKFKSCVSAINMYRA